MTNPITACHACGSARATNGACPHCDNVCPTPSSCRLCERASKSDGAGPGSQHWKRGGR